ncbi:NMD3 family-domain-containing protein [Mycena maculata]|uniref:60S ribosomal export protein NMD3 n=1 Tax=Mycena maculata TaxID=230809 RepID=A0AAD7MUI4_9AGAR|nr:NMD3 family-domain-containing protein [Mycena maculata]
MTIQKEVLMNTILEQTFELEYPVQHGQFPDCAKLAAKNTWNALVQVCQKVPHKQTFLFLKQLILKHGAQKNVIAVKEVKDRLGFFYSQQSHAIKMVDFLPSVVPVRLKSSEQLLSSDTHTNTANYKFTAMARWEGSAFDHLSNGYQELIDSPEIDVIYNPLLNGLYYEWTMKALAARKHVLLEKPAETRKMFELADHKGLVLLEARHYRQVIDANLFHPVANHIKAIIESGELGPVKSTKTSLAIPQGIIKPDDIRFNYSIGGGALMDMGCYTINAMHYFTGADPTSTVANFVLLGNITSTILCDLAILPALKIIPQLPDINATIECEKGCIQIMNYVMPTAYHSITTLGSRGGRLFTEGQWRAFLKIPWKMQKEITKGEKVPSPSLPPRQCPQFWAASMLERARQAAGGQLRAKIPSQ